MSRIVEVQLNRITRVKYIQESNGNIRRYVNEYPFGWTTPLEHAFVEHIMELEDQIEKEKELRIKYQRPTDQTGEE